MTGQDLLQGLHDPIHLFIRADGDAQIVLDLRLVKAADDDPAGAQCCLQIRCCSIICSLIRCIIIEYCLCVCNCACQCCVCPACCCVISFVLSICFRNLAYKGEIPGVRKASW